MQTKLKVGFSRLFLALPLLIATLFAGLPAAKASSVDIDLHFNINNSSVELVNGSTTGDAVISPGYAANLYIYNDSAVCSLSVKLYQSGVQITSPIVVAASQGTYFTTSGLNSVVTATGLHSCGPGPTSNFYVQPAVASMTCTLSGSQWNLSGNFSSLVTGAKIVNNSNAIYSYPVNTSTPDQSTPIGQYIDAQKSSQIYQFYGGSSQPQILAQASCPAYNPPAASSSTPTNTSAPTTSTPSSTSTTPTTSSQPAASTSKATSAQPQTDTVKIASSTPKKASLGSNTYLLIAAFLLGFAVIIYKLSWLNRYSVSRLNLSRKNTKRK